MFLFAIKAPNTRMRNAQSTLASRGSSSCDGVPRYRRVRLVRSRFACHALVLANEMVGKCDAGNVAGAAFVHMTAQQLDDPIS